MPHRLECPKCHSNGHVRAERLITRGEATTVYRCGLCAHEWYTSEPPPMPIPVVEEVSRRGRDEVDR